MCKLIVNRNRRYTCNSSESRPKNSTNTVQTNDNQQAWAEMRRKGQGRKAGQVPGDPSGKGCCRVLQDARTIWQRVEGLGDKSYWGDQVRQMILIRGRRQTGRVGG